MASINYVKLVNRTQKTLSGQFDGRQFSFPPGYEGSWPENQALKFKEQNPVMGTEDYFSGYKEYLLAIPDHGDDITPIEQTDAIEKWDRSAVVLPPGTQLVTLKGRGYHPMQDRGRPAPDIRSVVTESIEPTPGFSTETISISDPVGFEKP